MQITREYFLKPEAGQAANSSACKAAERSAVAMVRGVQVPKKHPRNIQKATKMMPKTYHDATKCYHGLVASHSCVWPQIQWAVRSASQN